MATAKIDAVDDKEQALPVLTHGELVDVVAVQVLAKKTRPPSQYTEGALIDDMDGAGKYVDDAELRKILKRTSGLGTGATRAAIIESLKDHKYLEKSGKYIVPTTKGVEFITWLDAACPGLTDVALTAKWEAELDVVAEKGGGLSLESRLLDVLTNHVATLKRAPALGLPATPKETSSVSDSTAPRRASAPTEKMVSFATRIAEKVLPNYNQNDEFKAAVADFDACKAFIDKYKDQANKPSDKAIAFAQRIAKEISKTIPEEALKDARQLSAWIDENKQS